MVMTYDTTQNKLKNSPKKKKIFFLAAQTQYCRFIFIYKTKIKLKNNIMIKITYIFIGYLKLPIFY